MGKEMPQKEAKQDTEATQVSFNRHLDKEDVVHVYDGILLAIKKMTHSHLQQDGWILRVLC